MKPTTLSHSVTALTIAITTTLASQAEITLEHLSTFHHNGFAVGAAEIATYDAGTQRVFVVNAQARTVDVLDITDPTTPVKVGTIDASALGGSANSVAAHDGTVAVAIEATVKQDPGIVAFYKASDLSLLSAVQVGALPDMVTFTPNGRHVLVANEGEPNDAYTVDPEGSVSIIDLKRGAGDLTQRNVRTASFEAFNKLDREKIFR